MVGTVKGSREPLLALAVGIVMAGAAVTLASIFAGPDLGETLGGRKANVLPVSPGPAAPFTMVFYSDPHTTEELNRVICDRMVAFDPDLAVCGGDCVFDGRSALEWSGYLIATRRLRGTVPMLAVKGNHDRGGLFEGIFDSPGGGTYYSIDYGVAHLVVLDTETFLEPGSEQMEWLEKDLAAAQARPFTIVFMHKPVISSGEYYVNAGREQLAHLLPLFSEKGVDLAFGGHEHFYERLESGGVVYAVVDCGGGDFKEKTVEHPCSEVFKTVHNYCVLSVRENSAVACVFDEFGAPLDFFTVRPR